MMSRKTLSASGVKYTLIFGLVLLLGACGNAEEQVAGKWIVIQDIQGREVVTGDAVFGPDKVTVTVDMGAAIGQTFGGALGGAMARGMASMLGGSGTKKNSLFIQQYDTGDKDGIVITVSETEGSDKTENLVLTPDGSGGFTGQLGHLVRPNSKYYADLDPSKAMIGRWVHAMAGDTPDVDNCIGTEGTWDNYLESRIFESVVSGGRMGQGRCKIARGTGDGVVHTMECQIEERDGFALDRPIVTRDAFTFVDADNIKLTPFEIMMVDGRQVRKDLPEDAWLYRRCPN